jgi:DNA-binding MarR family transcriptional regulator
MDREDTQQLINDLLGDAHVFVAAVSGVMENALLSRLAGRHLTLSQLKILKLIDLTEADHVGDVAAFLGVSDAAASKAVDRLVRQKYLRRSVAESDRRSSDLSLAPAGRKLLRQYEAARDKKLAAAFGDLNGKEVRRTSEFLERLTKGIVNGSANPEEICLQCGIYLKKRCLVRDAVRADCHYQRRRKSRQVRKHATQVKVPAGRRPRVGPPG